MKNYLFFTTLLLFCLGCSEVEEVKYEADKTFLAYKKTVYDLPVAINSSSTVDIEFLSSSISSSARTYNLTVVPAETDANALTYSIPATFTIPANQYKGVFTITGTDNNLVTASIKKLTIKVTGLGATESIDNDKLPINIFEVCPFSVANFSGVFTSNTWWIGGASSNDVVAGPVANSIQINDFFSDNVASPNFILKYNANNVITFDDLDTGYVQPGQGLIRARMSTVATNVSTIDACNNRVSVWVNYYIPGVGSYGDKLEVFTKS
jgi:hypothetical protein